MVNFLLSVSISTIVCNIVIVRCGLSHVQLFATSWTIARQAPQFMGFPSKNIGVGCHFLLQGDLANPGLKPASPALQALSLPSELPGKLQVIGEFGL